VAIIKVHDAGLNAGSALNLCNLSQFGAGYGNNSLYLLDRIPWDYFGLEGSDSNQGHGAKRPSWFRAK
jgi:hypothetical protein